MALNPTRDQDTMTVSNQRQWQHFRDTPSGRRFQTRYRMRRAQKGGYLRKILLSTAGGLLMMVGVALLVLPGPGLLVMLIGAAFIAEESLFAARMLDRIDLWGARWLQRWRKFRATRATDHADRS